MKTALVLAGVSSIALVSGCAGGFRGFADENYGVSEIVYDKKSAASKLHESLTKPENGKAMVEGDCFQIPVASAKETSCQQQRNGALMLLLNVSDDQCQAHMRSIYGTEAGFNIVMGTLATLFSGAAAIAGSAASKSSQAALATFFNAERSLVNETVYKSMLVTAVSKKIREGREAKLAALLPKNLDKSLGEYPMPMVVADILQYHYTCSFMYGLEKALDEGTQGGTDARRTKLEQEKRTLEFYVDNRIRTEYGGVRESETAKKDEGIKGAIARIAELESQMLALSRAGTPATTTAKPDAKKDDPKPAAPAKKPAGG